MPGWLIAVIVVAAIVYAAATKGRQKRLDQRRAQAEEHRAEAQERARVAGEKELAARRQADEAQLERDRAVELEGQAQKTDPDTG